MLDDEDDNLLGSFGGIDAVGGAAASIDEIMRMQVQGGNGTLGGKLRGRKKQRASMQQALWSDDEGGADAADESDATPPVLSLQPPPPLDGASEANVEEAPAPTTAADTTPIVTSSLVPSSFSSAGVQDRSERYAVICGRCKALNSIAPQQLDERFVCQQCNQGLRVAEEGDRTAPPADSWVMPLESVPCVCEPCPDTGAAMTFEDWRGRVLRFYALHAPERVPGRQLDQMLRSWAGRERDLWAGMLSRYGAEPTEAEGTRLLAEVLAAQLPDDGVDFSGKAEAITVPAKARKPPPPPPTASVRVDTAAHDRLGLAVRELAPDERAAWDGGARGVVVVEIAPGSAGAASDLLPLHLIQAANGRPVDSTADLTVVAKGAREVVLDVALFVPALRCAACQSSKVKAAGVAAYACQLCGAKYVAGADKIFTAAAVDSKACPQTGTSLTVQDWRLRILHLYAKYSPDRVHGRQVDQILRSWAGREDELWKNMVARYGAAPEPEEGAALLAEVLAQAAPPEDPEPQGAGGAPRSPARVKEKVGAKMTAMKQILALKARKAKELPRLRRHKDPLAAAPAPWAEAPPQDVGPTYDE
eukprot:TRINITY_DN2126_c0_g1_i1.p1 TRINITY_DN2126_c0_g1~~TRINITY_DN2126_c0_g1_i1.p1  ORF type:complete len:589 (+),score=216.01 TRINITY_DN2126_c0_g1_i1:210-1976(+)